MFCTITGAASGSGPMLTVGIHAIVADCTATQATATPPDTTLP
jgi:hypothetical protein